MRQDFACAHNRNPGATSLDRDPGTRALIAQETSTFPNIQCAPVFRTTLAFVRSVAVTSIRMSCGVLASMRIWGGKVLGSAEQHAHCMAGRGGFWEALDVHGSSNHPPLSSLQPTLECSPLMMGGRESRTRLASYTAG